MPAAEPRGSNARETAKTKPQERVKTTKPDQSSLATDQETRSYPGDSSQATFERHAALLSDSRMSQPMYARQRAMIVQQLQRDYGNRYVQRVVEHVSRQRSEAAERIQEEGSGPTGELVPERTSGLVGAPSPSLVQRQAAEDLAHMKKPIQRLEAIESSPGGLAGQREMYHPWEALLPPGLIRGRASEPITRTNPTTVQPKLTVGPARDKYEQEADQVAKQVVGMINGGGEQTAQRQEPEEEKLLQGNLVRRQIGVEGEGVAPEVEDSIQKARGQGQPLPDKVRKPMEDAFGADFSGVQVHTGTESESLNKSISARAFTTGQDIFFSTGEYSPQSAGGKETIAHELTHVIQQNSASIQKSPNKVGDEKDQVKQVEAQIGLERGDTQPGVEKSIQRSFVPQEERTKVRLGGKPLDVGRVKKVKGKVKPTRTKNRPPAPNPWSFSQIEKSLKWKRGSLMHQGSYDKGHIMALQLGGPDEEKNVVPQWGHWQRTGEWRGMERTAYKRSGSNFEVSLEYTDGRGQLAPLIPVSFSVRVGPRKVQALINEPAIQDLGKTFMQEASIELVSSLAKRAAAGGLGKVEAIQIIMEESISDRGVKAASKAAQEADQRLTDWMKGYKAENPKATVDQLADAESIMWGNFMSLARQQPRLKGKKGLKKAKYILETFIKAGWLKWKGAVLAPGPKYQDDETQVESDEDSDIVAEMQAQFSSEEDSDVVAEMQALFSSEEDERITGRKRKFEQGGVFGKEGGAIGGEGGEDDLEPANKKQKRGGGFGGGGGGGGRGGGGRGGGGGGGRGGGGFGGGRGGRGGRGFG